MADIVVNWEILSVDDNTGDIIVRFYSENKENKVLYSWQGDKDSLITRLNEDATRYTQLWMCSYIPSGIKSELLNATGSVSSADTVKLDNVFHTLIKAESI